MRRSTGVGLMCAATCVALGSLGGIASAARAPITGQLSEPGHTLIALAANGVAATVSAPDGNFSVVPPADTVTLHLRRPDGTYGGPVVLQEEGAVAAARRALRRAGRRLRAAKRAVKQAKSLRRQASSVRAERRATRRLRRAKRRVRKARARREDARTELAAARDEAAERQIRPVLGVKPAAQLGAVAVNSAAGYALARLGRTGWDAYVDTTRVAQARDGIPIGAGVFGRVASSAPASVPGDSDQDGISDPLDIDDDGDLVLDDFDRSDTAGAAQATNEFHLQSGLPLSLWETANANAATLTTADVDSALSRRGLLLVGILPGDSSELDCGPPATGLIYCRNDGTGKLFSPPPATEETFPPFPGCCDADNDGFGTLVADPRFPGAGTFLRHGATSAQIRTGDLLIERVTTGGVESQFVSTVQYVAATVPALVSYNDGQGNSATVAYPVSPTGPGTQGNGFPVAAGPGGDVVLSLTAWRPQRRPIEGEACVLESPPCEWVDIGGLTYEVGLFGVGELCPQSTLSETDPNLDPSPVSGPGGTLEGGLADSADDHAANPANTLTFTVNVTQCLASHGRSFNPGDEQGLDIKALPPNLPPSSEQTVYYKRP